MFDKSILFILVALVFTCCSNNDCTIEDWEGTYIGTKNCAGDIETDYAFEVRKNDFLVNSLEAILVDGQIFLIDGCNIIGGGNGTGLGPETYEGSLDGDELSVTANFASGSCTWIAVKQ